MAIKRKIMISLTEEDFKRLELLSHGHSKSSTVSEALSYLQYQRVKDFERKMDQEAVMIVSKMGIPL